MQNQNSNNNNSAKNQFNNGISQFMNDLGNVMMQPNNNAVFSAPSSNNRINNNQATQQQMQMQMQMRGVMNNNSKNSSNNNNNANFNALSQMQQMQFRQQQLLMQHQFQQNRHQQQQQQQQQRAFVMQPQWNRINNMNRPSQQNVQQAHKNQQAPVPLQNQTKPVMQQNNDNKSDSARKRKNDSHFPVNSTNTMSSTKNSSTGVVASKEKETSLTAGKPETHWRCDFCHVATFKSYTEAVRHENLCKNGKLGSGDLKSIQKTDSRQKKEKPVAMTAQGHKEKPNKEKQEAEESLPVVPVKGVQTTGARFVPVKSTWGSYFDRGMFRWGYAHDFTITRDPNDKPILDPRRQAARNQYMLMWERSNYHYS